MEMIVLNFGGECPAMISELHIFLEESRISELAWDEENMRVFEIHAK
jgi:hypothetical protein